VEAQRLSEGTVARAFELARSGLINSVADLEKRLREEGYANAAAHLRSPSLRKQLISLMLAGAPQTLS
jgi:hypothetical protein